MIKIKVDVDMGKLVAATPAVKAQTLQATKDCGQSLVATASGAAPHLEGILDSSGKEKTTASGAGASTTVSFHAVSRRGFNYAQWTHNSVYNLGARSRAKGGGVGMSGAHYAVGPKYLTRPLQGEAPYYMKYINGKLQNVLKSLGG